MRINRWDRHVTKPSDKEFMKGYKIGYEIGAAKAWNEAREVLQKQKENNDRTKV